DTVRFSISAPDPQPVITAIRSLVESQFGESAQPVPPSESISAPDVSHPFGVSRGIAIGRPLRLDTIVASVPKYTLELPTEIAREVASLRAAVASAIAEFDARVDRLRTSLPGYELEIFTVKRMLFADPSILKEVQSKIQ